MPTVRIDYFRMEGDGRNVTEARRDAGRKIQQALTGDYHPELLEWRGFAVLVWREPSGWRMRNVADESGFRAGTQYGCSGYADRQDCLKAARRHLAQLVWRPEDGDEWFPAFMSDRREQAGFREWVRFQHRYARARAAGLPDGDAHAYACGSYGRPDLVVHH